MVSWCRCSVLQVRGVHVGVTVGRGKHRGTTSERTTLGRAALYPVSQLHLLPVTLGQPQPT